MGKKTRAALFITFVVGFIIAAPLVVLYTAGYRYNFGAGKVVHTGVLSIKSIPKDADVFIDGKRFRDTTPAIIDDVLPGEHLIEIKKESYLPWKKRLVVKEDQTTFIDKAALYADMETNLFIKDVFQISYHQPSGNAFYIKKEERIAKFFVYSEMLNPSFLELPIDRNAEIKINWSKDGNYILVQTQSEGKPYLSIVNYRNKVFINLYDITKVIDQVWWDSSADDVLFINNKTSFMRVTFPDQQVETVLEKIAAASSEGDDYIFVQNIGNNAVVSHYIDDDSTIIALIPTGNYKFQTSPFGLILLENINRGNIILLDRFNANQPILLDEGIEHWQWHPDGSRQLLFSDGFDLNIYNADTNKTETLTRLSKPITALAWDPEAQVVFYSQAGSIFALELDHRDGRILNEVVAIDDIETFWIDLGAETLSLMGASSDQSGIFMRFLR